MIEGKGACVSWARAALVRAVKTFAQSAVALIPVGVMVTAVDWRAVILTALLAGVLSILTSLAGLPECDGGPLDGGGND